VTSNPVTFSTLACPEWTVDTVIARAAAFGYDGLEWRGGDQGHVSPAWTAAERQSLRRRVEQAGLASMAVTAYSRFVSPDPAERAAQLDHLRRHLDLAADLGARYVRTFIGNLPPGRSRAEATPAIVDCLRAAAEHAAQAGLIVAAESHDDWVRSSAVAAVVEAVDHPALRVLWDFGNAFGAGEDPAEGLARLKALLGYVHVKDGVRSAAGWRLTRFGEGNVPLPQIMHDLVAAGYQGPLCVEWERAWHPELDPAETALPEALAAMRGWLADLSPRTPSLNGKGEQESAGSSLRSVGGRGEQEQRQL